MDNPLPIKDLIETFKKLNNDFTHFLNYNYGITDLINEGLEPNYDNPETIKYYKTKNSIVSKIGDCLKEIYESSITNDYYFLDCPFKVYKKTFDERKESFFNKHIDADLTCFYNDELKKLNNPDKFRVFFDENNTALNYSNFIIGDNITNFKLSQNKKIEYLLKLVNTDDKLNIFQNPKAEKWFSDTLEELGVLDNTKSARSGFQVAANSIFINKDCKSHIFKYNLSKADFIKFLNNQFNAKIKDKYKLSAGDSCEKKVKELINLYKTNSI